MNGSVQVLLHDVNGCVSDGLSGLHERAAWDDHGKYRHQFSCSSDAVVDADTSASCIFDFSNLVNEKFRHAKRIESVAASHEHSPPLSNDAHHHTNVGYRTNYFATGARIRFRDAGTTGNFELHPVVAKPLRSAPLSIIVLRRSEA